MNVKQQTLMDTRKGNLLALMDEWGGPSNLAKKLHLSGPSYLSQLVSNNRPITEKTARKIEEELVLPLGWMDEHPEQISRSKPSNDLIKDVILSVGRFVESEHVALTPSKFAELVSLAYEESSQDGVVNEAFILRVISLVK